jgi:hypothetical protein
MKSLAHPALGHGIAGIALIGFLTSGTDKLNLIHIQPSWKKDR